ANLSVWYLDDGQLAQLSEFADRTMTLQATIQDGAIWLSDARNVENYATLTRSESLLPLVGDKAQLQHYAATTPIVDMVRFSPAQ
ncbi:YaeQ family protein, partial [Salmonella enterica subsp. enterica serovar Montevideo]|nr:YaeQ family protein [Salmonella enterica subsp. enterica serovar Montevideo]